MVMGRPTAYQPEFAETARLCCLIGATNEGLAERLDVSPRTIDRWIATIPEFAAAVREGREVADGKVVAALFARAVGLERQVTRAFCHDGTPVTATWTEQVLPDVRACIFWLRNRRPQQWRETRETADGAAEGLDFRDLEEASERVAQRARAEADAARSADAVTADFAQRLRGQA